MYLSQQMVGWYVNVSQTSYTVSSHLNKLATLTLEFLCGPPKGFQSYSPFFQILIYSYILISRGKARRGSILITISVSSSLYCFQTRLCFFETWQSYCVSFWNLRVLIWKNKMKPCLSCRICCVVELFVPTTLRFNNYRGKKTDTKSTCPNIWSKNHIGRSCLVLV